MAKLLALLLLLALCAAVPSQNRTAVRLLATEQDAWALAALDLGTQPESDWRYLRYLWIESGEGEDLQVCSLDLNEVLGRGTLIVRPVPVLATTKAGAKVLLARLDLRAYAPAQDHGRQRDLEELTRTWEELSYDPRFSYLFTADTLKFAGHYLPDPERLAYVRRAPWKEVDSAPYVHSDGQTYTKKWARGERVDEVVKVGELANLKDVVVARVWGDHIDPALVGKLTSATYSQAPLVAFPYFHLRATSSIKDEKEDPTLVFSTLFGGLYYEFSGLKVKSAKGTDLDNLLARFGIGNVEKGITFREVFDGLRSDQKVAMAHSQVTDSPRAVFIFPSLGGRVGDNEGLVRITFDLKKSSIDLGKSPIANLLRTVADAHEVFVPKRNGLVDKALFGGDGSLQDEAPFNVAKDFTQPAPRLGRLQTSSCSSCHGADGSDGFRRLDNDAKTLLRSKLEIFGDLSQYGRSYEDTLDRIYGAFTGDPERAYVRGRDDHARAVLKATGPWKASTRGQADVAQLAARRQVKLWLAYDGLVDPQSALQWLGLDVPKEEAVATLKALLPPDKHNLGYHGVGESARAALLKAGISITRADFALEYAFLANRAKQRIAELRGKK